MENLIFLIWHGDCYHIVVLREIAVSVKMNKHVRKEFITIIKPLKKIEGFPDEAYELLSDTIGYHPGKLAVPPVKYISSICLPSSL